VSKSQFVCWRDGLPITTHRGGWRHALGGATGSVPRHRKHLPVPIERTEYVRAFAVGTPLEDSRSIAVRMAAADARINGPAAGLTSAQKRMLACLARYSRVGHHDPIHLFTEHGGEKRTLAVLERLGLAVVWQDIDNEERTWAALPPLEQGGDERARKALFLPAVLDVLHELPALLQ
jgi:hypothetical protein